MTKFFILQKIFFYFGILFLAMFIAQKNYAQMEFVENKGQWDTKVKYRGDFETGSFFIENNGYTVLLHNADDMLAMAEISHGQKLNAPASKTQTNLQKNGIRSHAYKVSFLGGNLNALAQPEKSTTTYNNYFIGNDKTKWASKCKIYQTITYKNIYPNIDIRYYSEGSSLKYDLVVNPGGNPESILMKYNGADKLSIKNKELIIETSVGSIKELYPYTYQTAEGFKQDVECKYIIEDDIVRFKVSNYNPKETLVIDPSLIFSTFSGSRADNWGYTATPGPGGTFFAGGIAFGTGFPTTVGPVFGGGVNEYSIGPYDIAIMKFTADGSNRIYATYIGGNGNEQPHSMMSDAQGNLIIAGRSSSPNYPRTFSDPLQLGGGGKYDIIVTKLNPSGIISASLIMGGSDDDGVNIRNKYAPNLNANTAVDVTRRNYGDDARSEVLLDAAGNIFLVSCTQSNSAFTGFPVKNAFQPVFGGGRQDGVIIKFPPNLSSVLFSTYFGGIGDDACFVAAINNLNGNLYVAGGTSSTDLPGNTTGVLASTYQGGDVDGFITQIDANGIGIIRTTYQGTSGSDLVYGIQFDKKGFPYTMGTTTGNWPVFNAPFSNTGAKQFITKLTPDLSGYVYSTVFGTNAPVPNISPVAFLVDRCENVYVSGWGGIVNSGRGYETSGTSGMPEVNPLPGIYAADGSDFFFFVMERNAQSQLFGSHFGQNGGTFNDHVDGGTSRFDANGIIYQAVCANCNGGAPFYTTPGVWSIRNGSRNCNQASVKIEMNFAGVGASIRSSIDGVIDTVGCVPIEITFTDTLAKGKSYIWDFGDGSPRQTTLAPNNFAKHTYDIVGRYTAMVITIDPASCNFSDTAYITVKVGDNEVNPNFKYSKVGDCNSLQFAFENITTAVDASKFTATSFLWDFGDGTPLERANLTPIINHTFPAIGSYKVRLLVDDTSFCNAPIFKDSLLRISANVNADFETPPFGCAPYNAIFKNTSLGGTDFKWEFGDTQTSTDGSPIVTHLYANKGTYKVRLIANDINTCNKTDTSDYKTIIVYDKPTARFDWSPQPPVVNTRTFFTNLSSSDATRFLWNFGDGESSTEVNPIHQYNETNSFDVELIAYNNVGCTDTFPLVVTAIINPLLDVPNAFTPGKFGTNGIVKVVGFGITKMDWKIYNRWGQVVFATNDRRQGWDGTFKGALQATDVYTYTLDAEFSDGKKVRKTGDISLLR